MKSLDSIPIWLCGWTLGAWCALLPGLGMAEQTQPAELDSLAAEVSAAYLKVDSFLATHRAIARDSRTEITVGVDQVSGIFAFREVTTKEGEVTERRLWSPAKDVVYTQEGTHAPARIDNLRQRLRLTEEFMNLFGGARQELGESSRVWLAGLLIKEGIHQQLGFPSSENELWSKLVQGGSIISKSAQEVAFNTAEFGILRVSRQTGMMVRQVLKGPERVGRVLELQTFKLNPGRAAVAEMFAGWKTAGAGMDAGVAYLLPTRLACFQAALNQVDLKRLSPDDLNARLVAQRGFLRRFAKDCIVKPDGFLADSEVWSLLNLDKIRAAATATTPGSTIDNQMIAAQLSSPKYINEYCENAGARLAKDPSIRSGVIKEIFGADENDRGAAATPAGVQARERLEQAMIVAYGEAMAEHKLAEFVKSIAPPVPPVAAAQVAQTDGGTTKGTIVLKIDRPEKPGRKTVINVKSGYREVRETTRARGAPEQQNNDEAGTLRAVREVLAVGANGRATKLKLLIQSLKFTTDPNTAPKELFPHESEVMAELKDGETIFTMNGKPAAADLDQALQSFGLIYDGPDSDVIFSTKEPHAVGEEWNANLREVIKQPTYQNFTFDLQASTGKVRLARVEKIGGVECYIVTCEMTLIPSGMVGQPGADMTGSVVKFATTIPVPVDPSVAEQGGKTDDETKFIIRFKSADGSNPITTIFTKAVREEEISEWRQPGK